MDVAEEAAHQHELERGSWPGTFGDSFEPSLLMGEAGIGYFYLRLAHDDVPSVLLPSCGQSIDWADTGAEPVAEIEREMARVYIDHFFSRTRAVLDNIAPAVLKPDLGPATPTAAALGLEQRILKLEEGSSRDASLEVFALERMCLERGLSTPYICDELIQRLEDPRDADIETDQETFRLAESANLIDAERDWDQPPSNGDGLSPVQPTTYAVYCQDGLAHLSRLTAFSAAVLKAAVAGASLQEITGRVIALVGVNAYGNCESVPALVRAQLNLGLRSGLLERTTPRNASKY